MKNKGIGRIEIITMILIFMVVFSLVMWYFIGVANRERYTTMRKSASSMSLTLATNINSFHNSDVVYLGEAVREGYIKGVSSPFSGKNCSLTESKIVMENAKAKVTLRCDNYLIDNEDASKDYEDVPIYKVSDWKETKPKGKVEEKVLYNCIDGDEELYSEYYEELYFVSLINKDFGSTHYNASTIEDECEVITKTFYRTKKLIK